MTFYLSHRNHQLLLALAWAAPLTTGQLHRLVAPGLHPSSIRKELRHLRTNGAIRAELRYGEAAWRRPPHRLTLIWSLTPMGFAMLAADRLRPREAVAVRWSLLEHDLMLGELVVSLVDRGRTVLSGIYLDREVRLDARYTRPICDAIVILRRSPAHALASRVPWLSGPPAPEEAIRGYAIEIDRRTEGIGIIREKALSYRAIWRDTEFYRRYGRLPVPLWIVPTERRLEAVMTAWAAVWPEGLWLIATDAGLQQDLVEEWDGGKRRTCRLLEGWELRPPDLQQNPAKEDASERRDDDA